MSVEKAIPKGPLKLIFPSSLCLEPPDPISPLSPGSPNILSLPSLYPTLPPSQSPSQICLCFSLTSRCPLRNKDAKTAKILLSLLFFFLWLLFCVVIVLLVFQLAVRSLAALLSWCHVPALQWLPITCGLKSKHLLLALQILQNLPPHGSGSSCNMLCGKFTQLF